MELQSLKNRFFSLVAPDLPNEWDVEEAVEKLTCLDETRCRSVLDHVRVIWPVSHSLCFDYLKMAASALDCIELQSLSDWVNRTLDQYEKNGLRAAQRFMADVEENFLCTLRGESGLRYPQVERRLLAYLRGLSATPIDLAAAEKVYTDTTTVYVPDEMTWSKKEAENFFLYKLIVTYQWAFSNGGTYTVRPESADHEERELSGQLWLPEFLTSFSDPRLARDIYHFLETIRISAFLKQELPGLMRRKKEFFADPANLQRCCRSGDNFFSSLQKGWLSGYNEIPEGGVFGKVFNQVQKHEHSAASPLDSIALTQKLYSLVESEQGNYSPVKPFIFQGEVMLESIRQARNKRVAEVRQQFVDALATRMIKASAGKQDAENNEAEPTLPGVDADDHGIALIINNKNGKGGSHGQETLLLTINNETVEPGAELEQAATDVIRELGYIPDRYISSAAGQAGNGYGAFVEPEQENGQELIAPVTYDEWDYRRNDFRKNWCILREKEIQLSHSTFLDDTRAKYHGQIVRLRYQFEMMRTRERYMRRQRDGEDIDLDAMIESIADSRAGLAPSDRLFVRLKRDERDIAVLFLVDMSNSTQGWVGKVIKESLVLLCEALDVVGDRYAIYGFSGMRRLRSDFFQIKHIDEPYDDSVKQRISSIGPKEYTRMGPAIRHAVSILQNVDSRVKLLITLSDGKPEDYDDYKGIYAIEDTRHALIEAKSFDIHPFCITIDRHAREYIDHMFGDVNYIQIDDAVKLPLRIPEIYRVLTT